MRAPPPALLFLPSFLSLPHPSFPSSSFLCHPPAHSAPHPSITRPLTPLHSHCVLTSPRPPPPLPAPPSGRGDPSHSHTFYRSSLSRPYIFLSAATHPAPPPPPCSSIDCPPLNRALTCPPPHLTLTVYQFIPDGLKKKLSPCLEVKSFLLPLSPLPLISSLSHPSIPPSLHPSIRASPQNLSSAVQHSTSAPWDFPSCCRFKLDLVITQQSNGLRPPDQSIFLFASCSPAQWHTWASGGVMIGLNR